MKKFRLGHKRALRQGDESDIKYIDSNGALLSAGLTKDLTVNGALT
jgi:hypothetical protein